MPCAPKDGEDDDEDDEVSLPFFAPYFNELSSLSLDERDGSVVARVDVSAAATACEEVEAVGSGSDPAVRSVQSCSARSRSIYLSLLSSLQEIRDDNKERWYKRMYDQLHKIKQDGEYSLRGSSGRGGQCWSFGSDGDGSVAAVVVITVITASRRGGVAPRRHG